LGLLKEWIGDGYCGSVFAVEICDTYNNNQDGVYLMKKQVEFYQNYMGNIFHNYTFMEKVGDSLSMPQVEYLEFIRVFQICFHRK
jgi:hypothetical protein